MKRVYFLKPIGMDGPVKIGNSLWPGKRRDALEVWSPFPLEIVGEIDGDERLEMRFHNTFKDSHERQEWFRWSPELQAVIDAVAAGTFDITTLAEAKRIPRKSGTPGPRKGMKWSEERKRQTRIHREIAKAEKLTGLFRDGGTDAELFLSDPFTHGVTADERHRRQEARLEAFRLTLWRTAA